MRTFRTGRSIHSYTAAGIVNANDNSSAEISVEATFTVLPHDVARISGFGLMLWPPTPFAILSLHRRPGLSYKIVATIILLVPGINS